MKRNIYSLIFRENDYKNIIKNPNQNSFGWEYIDNITYLNYQEALLMKKEYEGGFPKRIIIQIKIDKVYLTNTQLLLDKI